MTAVLRGPTGSASATAAGWALTDCTLEIPAGPGHRPGRSERRRQDHAAQPGRRAAAGRRPGTIEVLRRPAGRRTRRSWPRSASSPRTPRRTPGSASPTTCGSAPSSTRAGTTTVARSRIERLGLDPGQKAGRLSGGQRAQLALTLGLAKRPELLILDEPVASLDPLARREFLADADGGRRRARAQRRALLARGLRPRAGLRPPGRARRLRGAGRRRRRDAARHPPPAHRPAPRPGHRCRPTSRSSPPATPTGRARSSCAPTAPVLDPAWTRRPARAWRTSCWRTWTRPPSTAVARRARPWRCCDDLADLAPVPGPGRRRRRGRRRGRGRARRHRPAPGRARAGRRRRRLRPAHRAPTSALLRRAGRWSPSPPR